MKQSFNVAQSQRDSIARVEAARAAQVAEQEKKDSNWPGKTIRYPKIRIQSLYQDSLTEKIITLENAKSGSRQYPGRAAS